MTSPKYSYGKRKGGKGGVGEGSKSVLSSAHLHEKNVKEQERQNGAKAEWRGNKLSGGGEVLHRKGYRQEKSDREGKSGKRRWHIKKCPLPSPTVRSRVVK